MKTKQELITKLQQIDGVLRKFEKSVHTIISHQFTDAYWQGRKEALADLREEVGSIKEFYTDGDATKTTDSPTSSTTSS